jgi:hypothetical protein
MCSESVLPTMSGYIPGSTASTTSRLMRWKSFTKPLWTNSVVSCLKGWQLDCWTGDPIAARTCAMNAPDSSVEAISCRFSSFHAGSVER